MDSYWTNPWMQHGQRPTSAGSSTIPPLALGSLKLDWPGNALGPLFADGAALRAGFALVFCLLAGETFGDRRDIDFRIVRPRWI